MSETWKPVNGYEGLYEVSDQGRVRSLARVVVSSNGVRKHVQGRMLKPALNGRGYLTVVLSRGAAPKTYPVHRVVAIAFLENLRGASQVNHKDGIKLNNRAENLEWCSYKENQEHAFANGLHSKPKCAIVGSDGLHSFRFESTQQAGRWGFNQSGIVNALKGRTGTHAGFVWRYA